MSEATVICPKCKHEFAITEAVTASIESKLQAKYVEEAAKREKTIAAREQALAVSQAAIAKAQAGIDGQVAAKLQTERTTIASEEAKKARLALESDLTGKDRMITQLGETISTMNAKLGDAQKAQADLLRKQRELDDAKREVELTVEKRVQESIGTAREQAKKEAEESLKLKVAEGEHKIASMARQIDDLKKKAEEGSQQRQGEVAELDLEATLRAKFARDTIEPVPKGQFGGDAVHRVVTMTGQVAGTILWESKRTKTWSDGWLSKLREDQRAAKAEIAIIVTQILPKGVQSFDLIDGVWVTSPGFVVPLAVALRQSLVDLADARIAGEGQQTKMELVYQYLMGTGFKQRVQALVEQFTEMQDSLRKEQKWVTSKWAEREMQLELILKATAGMYGDLRGIAGRSLPQVEGLTLPALEAGETQK
jgi:hypothetical protein